MRYHVPRSLAAALAVPLLLGGLGLGVYTLSDEAMAIVANVPEPRGGCGSAYRAQRSRTTATARRCRRPPPRSRKTAADATPSRRQPQSGCSA